MPVPGREGAVWTVRAAFIPSATAGEFPDGHGHDVCVLRLYRVVVVLPHSFGARPAEHAPTT